MENKQIIKQLNYYYYGMLILAVVVGTLAFFAVTKELILPIDPLSSLGKALQSIVIMWVLITLPFGLFHFKQRCKRIAAIEDEQERLMRYAKAAKFRIILVASGMSVGIVVFYLMACYQSMLWLTAIAAIGWYFTKPTEKKMYFELHPLEEQY